VLYDNQNFVSAANMNSQTTRATSSTKKIRLSSEWPATRREHCFHADKRHPDFKMSTLTRVELDRSLAAGRFNLSIC